MIFTTTFRHSYRGELEFVWACTELGKDGETIVYNLKEILTNPQLQRRLDLKRNNPISIVDVAKNIYLPIVVLVDEGSNEVLKFQGDKSLQNLVDDDVRAEVKELLGEEWVKEELDDLVYEAIHCIDMIDGRLFKYRLSDVNHKDILKEVEIYNESSQGSFIDYTKSKRVLPYQFKFKETDEVGFNLPRIVYSTSEEEMAENASRAESLISKRIFNYHPYGPEIGELTYLNFSDYDLSREVLFGKEENNDLPLQENEERFYSELIKYIDDNMEQYCELKGLDLQYMIDNCIYKKTPLEVVFKEIVRALVNFNWGHSKFVPVGEFQQINDAVQSDSGDDEGGETSTDGVDFISTIEDKVSDVTVSYYRSITEFMSRNKVSMYAWAEVIIKLNRWGSRKPNKLTIGFPKSRSIDRYELDLIR